MNFLKPMPSYLGTGYRIFMHFSLYQTNHSGSTPKLAGSGRGAEALARILSKTLVFPYENSFFLRIGTGCGFFIIPIGASIFYRGTVIVKGDWRFQDGRPIKPIQQKEAR